MRWTNFGFESITFEEKFSKINGLFDKVSSRYDLMNDLMSLGHHRCWKAFAARQANLRPWSKVLDLAAGTGDFSLALARYLNYSGHLFLADCNSSMLKKGQARLLNAGYLSSAVLTFAEYLPFKSDTFDCVACAFGFRNFTDQNLALSEMRRVLKPGGCLLILEFSKIWSPLERFYRRYIFDYLSFLGAKIGKNEDAYRYLAESIYLHPDVDTCIDLMKEVGWEDVRYWRLSFGIVVIHQGTKF